MRYHYITNDTGRRCVIDQADIVVVTILSYNNVWKLKSPRTYDESSKIITKYELKGFEGVLDKLTPGFHESNNYVFFEHYPEIGY